MNESKTLVAGMLCGAILCGVAAAESVPTVDFSREILPILSDKCFVCHGPDTEDLDMLRLDSFDSATEDRGGYRAIDASNPDASEFLARILSDEDPMPPDDADKQLTEQEKQLLSRWVREGGDYAQHWAFVPPKKRMPAAEQAEQWNATDSPVNSIDAFVASKLASRSLPLAPPAERTILARRASLTLCGLPPELDELSDFLNDDRPGAYDRYVDRLLNHPRFGEHQARHWLDAVRYGDTHGLHLDNRRGVYPYRDWVVLALNSNLPLDEFITWQIAGDLMPDPGLQQLVATGYVRMNPTSGEGGAIEEEYQAKNNFDRTENLGAVLLGLTLTCARCHTHKYDPVPQSEYYRLMAFFNSTAEPALDKNKYDYGPTTKAPMDPSQWAEWLDLESRRKQLIAEAETEIQNAIRANTVEEAGLRNWKPTAEHEQLLTLADAEGPFAAFSVHDRAIVLAEEIDALQQASTTTLIAKELSTPRQTRILSRGEYNRPIGDPVQPGIISVMGAFPESAPRNRLGLAKWLTSPNHPTVARVLVNRIWQQTFGHGLVRTPEDFGLQGEYPTHPDLLDWLAVELQESDWDLKHLLRLMVTSRTFRQSSAWRDAVDDPENRLWSRGPSYRLDAEVIRDIGLWAGGLLDTQMGGEGVKPYQPSGMWKALAHPASNTKDYQRDEGRRLYRRSLYVYLKRTSPHPMMTLFDAPDRETSCVRRSRTSTALQSLALLNETQRIEMARTLAERLLHQASDDDARLEMLFQLVSSRGPTESERAACLELLQKVSKRYVANPEDALALLSTGEVARDVNLAPARHAGWTQVALTVLASDLALLLY